MGRVRVAAASAVVLAAAATAAGMFGTAPEAPAKRLLENLAKELEKKPDDVHLLYVKGRVHAIAYAQGEDAKSPPAFHGMERENRPFEGNVDAARLRHLVDGIRCLRRAAELAKPPDGPGPPRRDERPLIRLGLAWLLDDGARWAPRVGHPEGIEVKDALGQAERAEIDGRIAALGAEKPEEREAARAELRRRLDRAWVRLLAHRDTKDERIGRAVDLLLIRWWEDQALAEYRAAYALRAAADAAMQGAMAEEVTVSREAGLAILRLRDVTSEPPPPKDEVAAIEAHLKVLDARPIAITPVLFPVSRPAPLADLLPPGRTARFDVAGDGVPRTWPWPSADAAFLVWAPDPARPVASGRQLFGARTWWIFWRDGYEPLWALDDDGDGRLAGAELDGIGVWRDLDGDGASGAGEVTSAADFGVTWIAVRATRTEDGVPAADEGIGLRDGTTRPTYDWTPESLSTSGRAWSGTAAQWTPESLSTSGRGWSGTAAHWTPESLSTSGRGWSGSATRWVPATLPDPRAAE